MGVPERETLIKFILSNIAVIALAMFVGYLFMCEIAAQMYITYR